MLGVPFFFIITVHPLDNYDHEQNHFIRQGLAGASARLAVVCIAGVRRISPPTSVPACREIPTSRRTWTASSGARISWSTRAISCGRPSRPCNSTWTAGGPMRSIPMPWANLLLPAGRECLLLRGSSQLEPFCHTGHALCGEGHHQEPATAYEAGQERHHGCCHGGSHRGVCL